MGDPQPGQELYHVIGNVDFPPGDPLAAATGSGGGCCATLTQGNQGQQGLFWLSSPVRNRLLPQR